MRFFVPVFIGCGLSLAAVAADASSAESPQLAALQTMVNNLGYTTTLSDDKSAFSFTYTDKNNSYITFDLSKDAASAYGYVALSKLTPAQLDHAPYVKMNEFNDGGDAYFSMEHYTDHESLYMNTILATDGMTPQLLRQRLDSFTGDINDNESLWNPDKWK